MVHDDGLSVRWSRHDNTSKQAAANASRRAGHSTAVHSTTTNIHVQCGGTLSKDAMPVPAGAAVEGPEAAQSRPLGRKSLLRFHGPTLQHELWEGCQLATLALHDLE